MEHACSMPQAFEVFWAKYPKKAAKADAEKAFAKALKRASAETIMAALEKLAGSYGWTKDGGQFILHPATWLNRDGWHDEPQNEPPQKPRSEPDRGEIKEGIKIKILDY